MTKKMGLMALGLSMALLSGCGSDNDVVDSGVDSGVDAGDSGSGGDITLNTPAEVEKNVVGIWSVGCVNDDSDGTSGTDKVTLKDDGTGSYIGADYDAPGCTGNVIDSWAGSFKYIIGEATTGAAGEAAVEVDLLEEGLDLYTMLHFTSVNTFMMASGGEDDGDSTPETRSNDFASEADWVYTRQPASNLNTLTEVTKNIVGTWGEECTEDDGGSETSLIVFNDDNKGTFNGDWYPSPDCSGDAGDSWSGTFTYTIGEAAKGSAGEDALEVNIEITEDGDTEGYYTMAHFYTVNGMGLADNDDNDEENTPETRHNIFGVNNMMVRK